MLESGCVFAAGKKVHRFLGESKHCEGDQLFRKVDVGALAKFVACGWDTTAVLFGLCLALLVENKVSLYGASLFNTCTIPKKIGVDVVDLCVYACEKASATQFESLQECAVGRTHVLLLTTKGSLYCWGSGKKGQLGLGCKAVHVDCVTRIWFFESFRIVRVACGWEFSLAITGIICCFYK